MICNVGVAPYEALGDDWFAGMDPENVKEFGWALEGEARLARELEHENEKLREIASVDPSAVFEQFDLPPSDKEVLAREDFAQVLRESMAEQSRNGVWGWVDDDIAFTQPWGFNRPASPCRLRFGMGPRMSSFLRLMASGSLEPSLVQSSG